MMKKLYPYITAALAVCSLPLLLFVPMYQLGITVGENTQTVLFRVTSLFSGGKIAVNGAGEAITLGDLWKVLESKTGLVFCIIFLVLAMLCAVGILVLALRKQNKWVAKLGVIGLVATQISSFLYAGVSKAVFADPAAIVALFGYDTQVGIRNKGMFMWLSLMFAALLLWCLIYYIYELYHRPVDDSARLKLMLIKNELKVSGHSLMGMYLAVAITVAVMMISLATNTTWAGLLSALAMIVICIVLLVVTLISVLTNFNKTLYSPQGYLNFTLPVKTRTMLGAKTLVSMFWLALSYVASLGLLVYTVDYVVKLSNQQLGEESIDLITTLMQTLAELPSTAEIRVYLMYAFISLFVFCFLVIAAIFFAVTLSNTRSMQKLGGFSIILVSIAEILVINRLGSWIARILPLQFTLTDQGIQRVQEGMEYAISMNITSVLIYLAVGVALLYGTSKLMQTKVNIK